MIQSFISLPRRYKQAISFAADFVLLLLAFWSAIALRFETLYARSRALRLADAGSAVAGDPDLHPPWLYRAVIRFMEDRVVFVVAGGVTLSVMLLAAGIALTHTPECLAGVLAIYWLLAIVYVGATRFLARSWFLRAERGQDARKRMAIYGAGQRRNATGLCAACRAGVSAGRLLRRQPGRAEDRGGWLAGVRGR